MNVRLFATIIKLWGRLAFGALDEFDNSTLGRRGPIPAIPLRALAFAIVYSAMSGTGGTLTAAARALADATPAQQRRLRIAAGTDIRYTAVVRALTRLARWIELGGDARGQAWLDAVIAPSAALDKPAQTRAVDTTLFDANCRRGGCRALLVVGDDTEPATVELPPGVRGVVPVSIAQAHAAVTDPSDLYDDRPRRRTTMQKLVVPGAVIRVSCDEHARLRRIDKPGGHDKLVLGYGAVAVVRADPGLPELCERIALRAANANDVPVGAQLLMDLPTLGPAFGTVGTRVVADRAFNNQHQAFLAPLRAAGMHVTFDIKSTDHGIGLWHDNWLIDGMLFARALPERLRALPRPSNEATKGQWDTWRESIAERMTYAFLPNGRPAPDEIRLHSPVNPRRARGRCVSVPGSNTYIGDHLWSCRRQHIAGEGCDMWNVTFRAADAPRIWQFPVWGTEEWEDIYRRRNAVERYFAQAWLVEHLEANVPTNTLTRMAGLKTLRALDTLIADHGPQPPGSPTALAWELGGIDHDNDHDNDQPR